MKGKERRQGRGIRSGACIDTSKKAADEHRSDRSTACRVMVTVWGEERGGREGEISGGKSLCVRAKSAANAQKAGQQD